MDCPSAAGKVAMGLAGSVIVGPNSAAAPRPSSAPWDAACAACPLQDARKAGIDQDGEHAIS